MGILSFTGKALGKVFDFRVDKWVGLDYIKLSIKQIINSCKHMFTPEKTTVTETFEESLQRLNLTETDLQKKEKEFTKMYALYLFIAFILFCYSLYLFFHNHWYGGVMALCLTAYPISIAFRFHFWLYQIKKRKLGCSFKEWWNNA